VEGRPDAIRLISAVCVAFILFIAAVHAGNVAAAARVREAVGATRGQFVDRLGRPIALSTADGVRRYRLPGLAPSVGYRDPDGAWHGLEARYNRVLSAVQAQSDWRTFFLHLTGRSAVGGAVHLTLDSKVQTAAYNAMGGVRGAVIALDPTTGAVLADVSSPSCAQSRLSATAGYSDCARGTSTPLLDRTTELLASPGSSFKTVTLTAAIDSGRFTLNSLFSGADVLGPSPYFDNLEYPSNITRSDITVLTLAQALAFSDNFTFAHVALTLGPSTWLKYALAYGLDRPIPFTLPVKASTVENGKRVLSAAELARSSFGAEDDRVTPLQMAVIAATIANGGVTMAPHLVSSVTNAGGTTTWAYLPHRIRRVMSARSAAQVAQGMKFVVDHGSGFNAAIHGIAVAGKTGTAASGGDKPNAWFVAFAPIKHPVVAVAVLHQFSGEGFEYAAPIARKVLIAALQERGYHVR
jgi:peptidoglycan glycosyltransferase